MLMRKAFYGTVLLTLLLVVGLYASGRLFSNYGSGVVLVVAIAAGGYFARQSAQRTTLWSAIVPSVVAAIFFWYATPSIGVYPTITLTVTGDKHPDAKGAEVWLTGIGYPSGQFSTKGFAGWASRDSALVGFGDTAKTIQVPRVWQDGAVLRMGRGPYSGVVEISIDGHASRIDLYSAIPAAADIPLPRPKHSLFSTPFRIVSTLLFAWAVFWIGAACASRNCSSRSRITFVAILVGTCVWLSMTEPSAPGDVEFVALGAPYSGDRVQPSTVWLGTEQGKVDRLPLPYSVYQEAAVTRLADISSLILQTDVAPLAVWTKAGQDPLSSLTCSRDHPLVLEFDPHRASELRVLGGGPPTRLPPPSAGPSTEAPSAGRLFAVCWPYDGGLMLGWTSAYFRFSAWSGPVHAVDRVYLTAPTMPVLMLRLSSATGRYLPMEKIGPGEYSYPALIAPWNHAELARRFVTSLIAGLCVLLVLPFGQIFSQVKSNVKAGRGATAVGLSAITFVWAVATIAIGWPGILGWDALSPVIQHGAGGISLWYGVGYPLLISAFINLGGLELSLLLKVVLVGIVVLWTALEALKKGARGWLIITYVVGMFIFSGTAMASATELRDAVNSVALSGFGLLCFVFLIERARRDIQLSAWHYAVIAVLGSLLVLLRVDNIVYAGALLAGFASVRPWRRNLLGCLVIAMAWLAVTPMSTRYVMEGGDHGKTEMRLYKVSAFVNPLVGMLRGNALTSEERSALRATLDKVLKVDYSVEHWTPSDVIYWHQSDKGPPSPETLSELQRAFVVNALKHPLEFFTLRTATFLKALGVDSAAAWIAGGHIARPFSLPPYFDHLAGDDAHWRSMVALAHYRPAAHLYPSVTATVYSWYERIALALPQLIFAVVVAIGFRRHPVASLVAVALLVRAALFWLMQPASVFLYLGELQILGTLLPLLAWLEWRQRARDV